MPKAKKSTFQQAAMPKASPLARATNHLEDPDTLTADEEWILKNAKAKELIMSTLAPGSEPWKIAEPLENAAEIWKALEAKYAPKSGERQVHDSNATEEGELLDDDEPPAMNNKPDSSNSEIKQKHLPDFYASVPDRDQRLLWAILHGGTPATCQWSTKKEDVKSS